MNRQRVAFALSSILLLLAGGTTAWLTVGARGGGLPEEAGGETTRIKGTGYDRSLPSCENLVQALKEAVERGELDGIRKANRELAVHCPHFVQRVIDCALQATHWPSEPGPLSEALVKPWPPMGMAVALVEEYARIPTGVRFAEIWASLDTQQGNRILTLLRALDPETVGRALRNVASKDSTPGRRLALASLIDKLRLSGLEELVFWIFDHDDEESRLAALKALSGFKSGAALTAELVNLYMSEDSRRLKGEGSWKVIEGIIADLIRNDPMMEALPTILALVEWSGSFDNRATVEAGLREAVLTGKWSDAEYLAAAQTLWSKTNRLGHMALVNPFYFKLNPESGKWLWSIHEDPSQDALVRKSILMALAAHASETPRVFEFVERSLGSPKAQDRSFVSEPLLMNLWNRDEGRALVLLEGWLAREKDPEVRYTIYASLGRWAGSSDRILELLKRTQATSADVDEREAAESAILESAAYRRQAK